MVHAWKPESVWLVSVYVCFWWLEMILSQLIQCAGFEFVYEAIYSTDTIGKDINSLFYLITSFMRWSGGKAVVAL